MLTGSMDMFTYTYMGRSPFCHCRVSFLHAKKISPTPTTRVPVTMRLLVFSNAHDEAFADCGGQL